ncbi:MAG: glycosyltransferase family 39 protein [Candidatus Omnitrophica bacterium]|nr:glycosyltransferase family 39 protein [Candidatus Omnitrophota bacterium]
MFKKLNNYLSRARLDYFLLAGLWLLHAARGIVFAFIDNFPKGGDMWRYLSMTEGYIHILQKPSWDILRRIFAENPHFPPLFPFLSIPVYLLSGRTEETAYLANLIFLGVLILSTYGIGKRLHARGAGLLASLVISTYSSILVYTGEYMMPIALTSIVTLSIYTLLLTDDFASTKFSVLFGLSLGLGLLTKWTFVAFLLGPGLLVVFMGLVVNKDRKIKRSVNISLSALTAFIIASPYYFYSFWHIVDFFNFNKYQDEAIPTRDLLSLKSLGNHFMNLPELVGRVFFILFIIGLVITLIKFRKKNSISFSWFGVSYIIFSFLLTKLPRYIVPSLGAVALISISWIFYLRNRIIKVFFILFISILCLLNFIDESWMTAVIPEPLRRLGLVSSGQHVFKSWRPWKTREIFDYIVKNRDSKEEATWVLVLYTDPPFVSDVFNYYSIREDCGVRIFNDYWYFEPDCERHAVYDYEKVLKASFVILHESILDVPDTHHMKKIWKYTIGTAEMFSRPEVFSKLNFMLSREFEIPDGLVRIYKRVSDPDQEEKAAVINKAIEMDPLGREEYLDFLQAAR